MLDEVIASYAAKNGLTAFVVDAPAPDEYVLEAQAGKPFYRKTGRLIRRSVQANGRPRIQAPFRLFGHVVCTRSETLDGIYWCFDLLRSGYVFVHCLTSPEHQKIILPWHVITRLVGRCRPNRLGERGNGRDNSDLNAALSRLARHRACSYQPQADRILMITATLDCGGTERRMVATVSGLVQRGWDVRVLKLAAPTPGVPTFEENLRQLRIVPQLLADFAESQTAEDAELAGLPRWLAEHVSRATTAIRHHRPTVVHAWLDQCGLVAALAATRSGVPRIVISFGSLPPPARGELDVPMVLQPGYMAITRNPNASILNNSVAGAAGYERWLGLRSGSIRIVRNAFVRGHMPRPPEDEVVRFRASLGIAPGQPLVGAVMRLSHEKDVPLWIATASEIARTRSDVMFGIWGYGPLQDETARLINVSGLRERVRLAGPPSDLALLYAAFDAVLLTSIFEGVPNMLIEAQAAGCPVVTVNVGGAAEAVANGVTGIVVAERSAAGLAHAVAGILADLSWRQRTREKGPAFVDRKFGFERMIDETIAVYGIQQRTIRS